MSQESAEFAQEMVAAVNRQDDGWLLDHADEDLEFIPLRAGTEGSFRGRQGVRAFIEDTRASFDVFEISLDEVRAVGEMAVWSGTLRIRGMGSGIETEVPTAAVFTVRDGRLLYFKDYGDMEQALEAAGAPK